MITNKGPQNFEWGYGDKGHAITYADVITFNCCYTDPQKRNIPKTDNNMYFRVLLFNIIVKTCNSKLNIASMGEISNFQNAKLKKFNSENLQHAHIKY